MADNCIKECPLHETVRELKQYKEQSEKRFNMLERQGDKNEERVDMIFKILNEIKSEIKSIAGSLDVIKQKPGKTYEKLQFEVLKYIVLLGCGYLAAKYLIIK